jgi:hypothetical protein
MIGIEEVAGPSANPSTDPRPILSGAACFTGITNQVYSFRLSKSFHRAG